MLPTAKSTLWTARAGMRLTPSNSHEHGRSILTRAFASDTPARPFFTWPSRRFLQYRLVPIHKDVVTDLLLSLPKLLLKLEQFRHFLILREIVLTKIA